MIIDTFTHMAPSSYVDKLATVQDAAVQRVVAKIRKFAQDRPQAADASVRVELLKKHNIDYQVVTLQHDTDCNDLPLDGTSQLAIARAANDSLAAAVEQSKGVLACVASVPLSAPQQDGLKEMERAIKSLGLKGFQINTNMRGKPVDAPEFAHFWAKAADLDVPVFIHPADPVSQNDRTYEVDYNMTLVYGWPFETVLMLTRLIFSGIMDKYPGIKIVSHHLGGGMIPFLWGRVEESYPPETQQRLFGRVLPRPVKEYFKRFYYDTAVGDHPPAVRCCRDTFGSDRMLLSTDFPHGSAGVARLETYPRAVRESGIPANEVEKILGGNASKLFGIR